VYDNGHDLCDDTDSCRNYRPRTIDVVSMINRHFSSAVDDAVWMRFGGSLYIPTIQDIIENVLRANWPNIWYPVLMSQRYEDEE